MLWKIFILLALIALALLLFRWTRSAAQPATADRIAVWKEKRQLSLFKDGKTLKTYRIALGRTPVGHKHFEGDGKTPEGLYTISGRNPESSYHLSLRISYPSVEDTAHAREAGRPPGGDIMIHGHPNGTHDSSFSHRDWTEGCIAVTNREIEEIWKMVPDGTPIELFP